MAQNVEVVKETPFQPNSRISITEFEMEDKLSTESPSLFPPPLLAGRPSKWPYVPFVFLLAFSYSKDDIEVFFLYFLFASTDYGCNFAIAFGIYLSLNAFVELAVQPVCAWLTDRFARKSTILLWAALLSELIIELIMVIPGQSFVVILCLQLMRSFAHSQNTLSIWKVFKQKLQAHVPPEQVIVQDDIINHMFSPLPISLESLSFFSVSLLKTLLGGDSGMVGITGEVTIDVYVFFSGYLLSKSGFSFDFLARFIYLMTILTSFLAFAISIYFITPKFVINSTSQNADSDIQEMEKRKKSKSTFCPYASCDNVDIDALRELSREDQTQNVEPTEVITHFLGGLKKIFTNPITAGAVFHALIVCLLWKVMSGAEPLSLASEAEISENPTLQNLCGGSITNLFYQYAWNNVFYVIGSLFFVVILVRVKPYTFFQYFYPAAAIFFCIALIPLAIESVPYWIKVISASILGVFPWFLYRYDDYLAIASCPTYYLGLLQCIIGLIRYVSPALAGVILRYDLEAYIITITLILLLVSIIFSAVYAFLFRKTLKGLLSTHEKSKQASKFGAP